jgi:hypothetical protein
LADIFRPFYRVADARDRQTGGAGLGLAITERAVLLHGGTVSASNAPGGGLIDKAVGSAYASLKRDVEAYNYNWLLNIEWQGGKPFLRV